MRFSLKISAVPGILTAVSFLELRLGLSLYEDHIIQWSPNNSRFGYNNKPLLVKEGDNIVFLCPNERRHKYTLYWTLNHSAYMQCRTTNQPDVHELMRCDANSKVYEFILKVSLFSELMHIPQFYPGVPVYFLS
ncbi:unnamed protein product, partial [Dicrocoelium dendriticum]